MADSCCFGTMLLAFPAGDLRLAAPGRQVAALPLFATPALPVTVRFVPTVMMVGRSVGRSASAVSEQAVAPYAPVCLE